MAVTATAAFAAVTAAAFFQIAFGRHATEFERLCHVLADGFLNLVHLTLRFEEIANHRISQGSFAFLLKIGDFSVAQLDALMLLVMKKVAFFIQRIELRAGFVVTNELGDAIANVGVFALPENGLAEFFGFLRDSAFFSCRMHDSFTCEGQ